MKTKIKVNEIFDISNRVIFAVTVDGDKYLIGDVFVNQESNMRFELKGIGMENQPDSMEKSLLVIPQGEYDSIQDFKDKVFVSDSD